MHALAIMNSANKSMRIHLSVPFLFSYDIHAETELLEPSFILTWIVILKQLEKNGYPDYKYSLEIYAVESLIFKTQINKDVECFN